MNKKDFLKDNNYYYFAKVAHDEKKYEPWMYSKDMWTSNDFLPKIFMSLDAHMKNEQDSEELKDIKDLLNVDVHSLYQINNLNRNYFRDDFKLESPEIEKQFIKEMSHYLEPSSDVNTKTLIKRWVDEKGNIKFDLEAIKNVREIYIPYYDVTPREYFNAFLKNWYEGKVFENVPFVNTKATASKYELMLKDPNSLFNQMVKRESVSGKADELYYLAFTRGIAKAYGNGDFYDYLEKEKDVIDASFFGQKEYLLWNFFTMFPFYETWAESQNTLYNRAYLSYLKLLDGVGYISGNFKNWSEINEDFRENFKDRLNDLAKSLVQVLGISGTLGAEIEKYGVRNKTYVNMFAPTINNVLYDYEYSYAWAYRLLYEMVIPAYAANDWELPKLLSDFLIEIEHNISDNNLIHKYINFFLNTVLKDKDSNFESLTDYSDMNSETIKSENYKEKAKEKFLNWLGVWSNRLGSNIKTGEI
ncbi:CDS14 family ICE transfer lipoprotein [Mycoplasma tauri]|uniref:CDS14 family ICE transfer lipoprotein n=1 Tax=Mycoplasma tauri TaxID=547987 RepID=UPI00358E341B